MPATPPSRLVLPSRHLNPDVRSDVADRIGAHQHGHVSGFDSAVHVGAAVAMLTERCAADELSHDGLTSPGSTPEIRFLEGYSRGLHNPGCGPGVAAERKTGSAVSGECGSAVPRESQPQSTFCPAD